MNGAMYRLLEVKNSPAPVKEILESWNGRTSIAPELWRYGKFVRLDTNSNKFTALLTPATLSVL